MGELSEVRQWFLDRNIDPELALKAGVRYDANRHAVLYPRVGMDHMPYGWKIRHLDDGRTYNDHSGISIKDCEPWTVLDGQEYVLAICEGETDAMCLATNIDWFPELRGARVIAVPGSSTFPNEWAGMFKGYDDIYLFPDPDDAGEQMVQRVCGLIGRTKVVRLDPDVGDLSDHVSENMGYLVEAVSNAKPVSVTQKLRRSNYDFERSYDLPHHILVDEAAKDTKLKRRGSEFYGKCPLHKDSDPSFSINPKKGVFWCHGCKTGGDIISYLQARDSITFKEAVRVAKSLQ